MKKPIAILGALVAASTLSAFGQDWITFEVSSKTIWDNIGGVTTFDPAGAGKIDAILLWAPVGTPDDLPSYGTEFGLRGTGIALDQVATNLTAAELYPGQYVNTMLDSGWNIAEDMNAGDAIAVATEAPGLASGQVAYNSSGGIASSFEVSGVTLSSGSSIQEIVLAYDSDAGSWLTGYAYGWSNPFDNTVGTSAADPYAESIQSSANQFAVVTGPEPTTLALAGLGGLSMLFLRRRKA
jgi:PEP-CTERM motif